MDIAGRLADPSSPWLKSWTHLLVGAIREMVAAKMIHVYHTMEGLTSADTRLCSPVKMTIKKWNDRVKVHIKYPKLDVPKSDETPLDDTTRTGIEIALCHLWTMGAVHSDIRAINMGYDAEEKIMLFDYDSIDFVRIISSTRPPLSALWERDRAPSEKEGCDGEPPIVASHLADRCMLDKIFDKDKSTLSAKNIAKKMVREMKKREMKKREMEEGEMEEGEMEDGEIYDAPVDNTSSWETSSWLFEGCNVTSKDYIHEPCWKKETGELKRNLHNIERIMENMMQMCSTLTSIDYDLSYDDYRTDIFIILTLSIVNRNRASNFINEMQKILDKDENGFKTFLSQFVSIASHLFKVDELASATDER
jgi:hypothetical protein